MTKPADPISLSPTITAPERVVGPEADALADKLFGLAPAEAPEAEAEAAPEPAPAERRVAIEPDPPGTATVPEEEPAEETPAEPEVLDLEALRAVAEKRKGTREQKSAAEQRARELEGRLQEIEQRAAADRQAADALRRMQQMGKSDPIGLLETLGIDVVPFLQNGHRQAIDRQGHRQKTEVEQLKETVAQLQAQVAEAKQLPVELAQHQQRSAEAARHRQEFVALTETSSDFPLLAAEAASDRLQLAQQAAEALVEAGIEDISHALVAKTVEKTLRARLEKQTAALGRVTPAEEPNDAGQSGRAAPSGRNTSSPQSRPRTLRQTHAAEPASPREKTPQERERAAEAILSRMFGK